MVHYLRTRGLALRWPIAVQFGLGIAMCAGPARDVLSQTTIAASGNVTQRVTVNAVDAPVVSVLKLIAERAALVPAFNEGLLPSGDRVTVHFREMPVIDAFRAVLRGTGVAAKVQSTGYVILVRGDGVADQMTGTLVGKVTDAATQRPVRDARVQLEGTKSATMSNASGEFQLTGVLAGKYTLTVRRLGYKIAQQTVTVADTTPVRVTFALSETATHLGEVVTTVTGPQRRLEIGNSIGVIKADSLVKEAPITSLSQLLTARVPGLVVSQGQGTVGGNVSLQIRGQSSLSLSTEPIVIVDGIRYTSRANVGGANGREPVSPLNDLNPNDVETVEVVKGPSAATLYGTDAVNGVIIVTTKRGKAGPPRWTAYASGMTDEIPRGDDQYPDQYYGWGSYLPWFPVYDACNVWMVAHGYCTKQDSLVALSNVLNSGRSSFLQPARSWTTGAGVSGGQASLRYFFSGNYDNQTGAIALPDTIVRLVRAQRGVKKLPDEFLHPNDRTSLNLRSNIMASIGPKLELGLNGGYIRSTTRSIDGTFRPYDRAINYDPEYQQSILSYFARTSTELNDRFVASANAQGQPFSWLRTHATLGTDIAMRNRNEIAPRDTTRELDPQGKAFEGRTRQLATSVDGGVNVTTSRGWATFRTSVGAQYVRTVDDVLTATGTDLPPGETSLLRAASIAANKGYAETVTLGTYVEEVLGINERLFLTGALRADGASAFGTGYKAAVYPKLSASWLVSQEPFVPTIPGLDELRMRAALGVSGRQALPTMALPSYSVASLPAEAGGGNPLVLSSLGNPQLRPERGREFETGFDVGALNRRVLLELTWYRRRTNDLILRQSQPAGLGLAYTNVGLVTEHGAEARLTATLLDTRVISWAVTMQRGSQGTKVVRLGKAKSVVSENGGYVEGYPIGARFITPLAAYHDTNGDGFIMQDEVQLGDSAIYVGPNTTPRTQTWTTNVGLFQQKLRFSALFDRQSGVTLINDSRFCNRCRERYDLATPLVLQAYIAARDVFTPGRPGFRYVESGSFTRLREVSAALSLPAHLTRAFGISSSSVSLSARNLALWSRFSGADPESVPISGFNDISRYSPTGLPQARSWSLRFDVGL